MPSLPANFGATKPPRGLLPPQEQEAAWEQVLARDPAANGRFVYAVSTTGIYCRPICPSRRPQRAHVQFFRAAQAAEAAGFRACLRCQPQRPAPAAEPRLAQIEQAAALLRADSTELLEALALRVGLSKFALLRGFQRALGVTPKEFARAHRRQHLAKALREGGGTVTEALYVAGFGSSSRLYEKGKSMLGMLPTTLQRGGAGAEISFTVVNSPLDRMLVATTSQGVCAVAFGVDDAALIAELHERFPKAVFVRDNDKLSLSVQAVLRVLGGEPMAASGLDLDVRRTAFQERVWQAMQAIPRGQTLTYGELAATIGSPGAAIAVGQACAINPVAVLIPCHRVLAKGGKLHNWRWGVERKERLLAMEAPSRSRGATSDEVEEL